MRCVFCESPEIKARTIIQSELAFAFPTNIPVVPGHLLICPKRCIANIADLDWTEIEDIIRIAGMLKPALEDAFGAEGFNVAWNEGTAAGQNVPHFHMHLLPRKAGDSGITEYEPRKFLYRPGSREPTAEAELADVAKTVRESLLKVNKEA